MNTLIFFIRNLELKSFLFSFEQISDKKPLSDSDCLFMVNIYN